MNYLFEWGLLDFVSDIHIDKTGVPESIRFFCAD